MTRSPELEALARSGDIEIADHSSRRNRLAGGALLILAGLVATYLLFGAGPPEGSDMLDGDEEFNTTSFRPPSYLRDSEPAPEPVEPEILSLPPPPPVKEEPDTTLFDVPPPAAPPNQVPPPDPGVLPRDDFPERYRSALIVIDGKAPNKGQDLVGDRGGEGQTVAGGDGNSKFLAAAASIADRSAQARKISRIDALVPEGTLIPGLLETAIVSDLPGQIRGVVTKDVYSFDGRRVLIPAGTRLIGEYQSELVRGQQRVFVIWTRLLRHDGVSVRLASIGADSLGRSGLTGRVDKKFRERFGAAILMSVVGAGASYLTGYGSRVASGDGDESERAEERARETLAETFSDMAKQVLGDNLAIPPTIHVPQGERIFVFVRQDLDFSALYPDPVAEALKEIDHERGLN